MGNNDETFLKQESQIEVTVFGIKINDNDKYSFKN
jgi:hypothetical protein